MELSSPEAMRKLVEIGVGISFLPALTVQESLEASTLNAIPVKGVEFNRSIGVAWRRGRYFGPAIRYLLDAIFERYGDKESWTKALGKMGNPVNKPGSSVQQVDS